MSLVDIKGRRIALVGGAGFIGHNLALKLKSLGAEVEVIDGLQVNNLGAFSSDENNVPNRKLYLEILYERLSLIHNAGIPLHVVDVRDYHVVSQILDKLNPQTIVHLAAVAHANQSNKNPHSTFDHSLRTLENTLDSSKTTKPHFVYLSSSMIYGNFAQDSVDETTPCEPLGIYGALKFSGEKMVIAYNQVFDMPYTIIRPSALYGERCVSRRVGQIFIENAFNGLDLQVAGDGTDCLDFTYIDDFVQGLVRVIENENSRGEIFNLTYGKSRSIQTMIDLLKEHFPELKVEMQPRDRLMPKRGTLSVDKARSLLGYDPQYPLEKGFVQYVEWYKTLFDQDRRFGNN